MCNNKCDSTVMINKLSKKKNFVAERKKILQVGRKFESSLPKWFTRPKDVPICFVWFSWLRQDCGRGMGKVEFFPKGLQISYFHGVKLGTKHSKYLFF